MNLYSKCCVHITIHNTAFFSNSAANNGGVLQVSGEGDVLIRDCVFNNNTAHNQGGAMWIESSNLTSNGSLQIINNQAMMGIIFAINSTLFFTGNTIVTNNCHGSSYPLLSEKNVVFDGHVSILNNYHDFTIQRVGSLVTTILQPSNITFQGTVDLTYNNLYSEPTTNDLTSSENEIFVRIFSDSTIYIPTPHNTALHSGGECIYQWKLNANISADRTRNAIINKGEGVYRLNSLLTSNQLDFSRPTSGLIKVCFCRNGQPDCSREPPTISVKRGQTFNISLVAKLQDDSIVPHTLNAFLLSHEGRLSEGQSIQSTDFTCKSFNYTVFSPHESEQLTLNVYSPCSNNGISQTQINVEFLPCDCPIGFRVSTKELSNCVCDCDPDIYPKHIAGCSLANISVKRINSKWINYINTTDQKGYQVHTFCPFDYCYPSNEDVWINLNIPKGSDAQCAFNRSGKLCGACKNGFSLSLGNSHCIPCSNDWLGILTVFAMAGIALVAFLLVCNLTVAVGTINGLIFYANIIAINHATFLPFEAPNFFTVFIAWLNLDFGFATCFYDGMNGYAKEWLQLAFPLYIILMVAVIIIACEYSTRVAKIFTKTSPVGTLATLILLSYTKSLRLIISALSFATLEYPDGSRERVWLTDANISYFEQKHIPLFLIALFILVVGIAYTLILFFYQWLLPCSYRSALRWIGSVRFYPFMDAYHAPYVVKHRYWTGLLLFVRLFLYAAVALNVEGNPGINLLLISCTLLGICLLKVLILSKFYKSLLLDVLENSFIFNILTFSVATLYIRETGGNQAAVAYTSTIICFITFLAILLYHTYTFVLPTKVKNKLNSFNLKAEKPKDEENNDIHHIQPITNDRCTFSVIDGKPPVHGPNSCSSSPSHAIHSDEVTQTSVRTSGGGDTEHYADIELNSTGTKNT